MRKNKPSRTARKVALSIITLGEKPGMDRILPPGAVQTTEKLLIASGVVGERAVRWSRSQLALSIYEAFDWMLPGLFEAFAYRKAFCERQVRDCIGAGATQILVLGAGYDTMAWRLAPEYPGVNFFEIDHPASARLKARGVNEMGSRDNLYLIAEDLVKQKLADVLKNHWSWDQDARTLIIAEGLVMYLSAMAVRDLFRQCALATGSGSRVVFTYMPADKEGHLDVGRWTGLMLWLQKLIGEPWIWSIRPEEVNQFLEELGWTNAPALDGTADKHGVEFYVVATKD